MKEWFEAEIERKIKIIIKIKIMSGKLMKTDCKIYLKERKKLFF